MEVENIAHFFNTHRRYVSNKKTILFTLRKIVGYIRKISEK